MTAPVYDDGTVIVHHGDCLDVLRTLPDASVDSVVTDPPYGLEFMGKDWDAPWKASSVGRGARVATERAAEMTVTGKGHATPAGPYLATRVDSVRVAGKPFQDWCFEWAAECLRVLKPGGHLLAFGGTRTWHRLAAAVEDAGFEIRDSIAWLYGSGFPKSLDVSKAIDKAAGAEREVVGSKLGLPGYHLSGHQGGEAFGHGLSSSTPETRLSSSQITAPATSAARQWEGWGTALKPAFEPIVVGRKPLVGTVAANVQQHGTGALNIESCRVKGAFKSGWSTAPGKKSVGGILNVTDEVRDAKPDSASGRWPANVLLDGDQADALNEQSGTLTSGQGNVRRQSGADQNGNTSAAYGAESRPAGSVMVSYGDTGGASRFFPTFRYEAKAPTSERPRDGLAAHPTVKPLELMRWLVRLVTPPGGLVLDPFAGSGTTAEACIHEHMRCITIEREADYLPLILMRLRKEHAVGFDFGGAE